MKIMYCVDNGAVCPEEDEIIAVADSEETANTIKSAISRDSRVRPLVFIDADEALRMTTINRFFRVTISEDDLECLIRKATLREYLEGFRPEYHKEGGGFVKGPNYTVFVIANNRYDAANAARMTINAYIDSKKEE